MTSSPAERVDVSVLVPVLNEEACIRETVAAMQAQRFDGTIEFLFMDGRSEDGTRSILEQLAGRGPAHPRDRQSRPLDTERAQRRPARTRAASTSPAWTRTPFYPPNYVAAGVERLRRGDVEWVSGPAIPEGSGRWSRLVSLALGTWLGVGGSRKWGGSDEIEVDTGVFAGRMAAARRSSGSEAGTRAGRRTRTRSWPRA